jgi:D-glycero-D-manno-heptose 1,7-bisphosphate phosphatase
MRCVFLDRDGVLNYNRSDYVRCVDDFEFLPGAVEAVAALASTSFAVVVVTNQSAIARGQLADHTLDEIHARMRQHILAANGRLDGVYVCPHQPSALCDCRKPRPGLLYRAAADLRIDLYGSYMIGDAASDIEAGLAAGCQPILVLTGRGQPAWSELTARGIVGYRVAADLRAAIDTILFVHAASQPRQGLTLRPV